MYSIKKYAFLLTVLVSVSSTRADAPLQRFSSRDPYYIYYGSWNPTLLSTVQGNGYRLVIVEPRVMTRAQVADLQNGTDNVSGTADDIRVVGYISFGEDNRSTIYQTDSNGFYVYVNGHRVIKTVSGGTGPRIDPRGSSPAAGTLPDTLNSDGSASLGTASPGGTGYASFYVDNPPYDGKPEFNGEFAGAYVNAGDPAWFAVLKSMTVAADGNCGLDEILTTTTGLGLGCDGIFIDTMDTCAPNSFSPALQFEWTTPGFRQLLQTARTTFPGKLLVQNRATFFFNPEFEAYGFTTRPFVDAVMFESYYADSNDYDTFSPYFLDSKYRIGLKLSAEADRADGFSVIALGYLEPRAVRATITINGNVSDWPSEAKLQSNGEAPDAGAINAVYATNNGNYLYLRISTDAGTDLNTAGFNLYIDTDDVVDDGLDVSAAGYVPTGAGTRIRSELLYQNGGLYSQDTGLFNVGSVGTATRSANTAKTEWEIRIPRSLVHPATHPRLPNQAVFGADGSHILMLLTWDTGAVTQYFPVIASDGFEKNLGYRFEKSSGSVYDTDFVESQKVQGWSLYQSDKFLSQAPNTRAQTWNTANIDTSAPVWSTTGNGFTPRGTSSFAPVRTGIQAAIPDDGAVIVRWDTATDQTRPVRYKIYYAPASPAPGTANLNTSPWQNTGIIAGTAPADYAYPVNLATAVANEHTVTGLTNGTAYAFIVRAVDSVTPTPYEDANVVTLTAMPRKSSGSVYAGITVDGGFSDWPSAALVWEDPSGDHGSAASDLKAVWMANDRDYVYFRIDTWNTHDFHSQGNNLYFDADRSGATGFDPFLAGLLGSELLMQGDALYSEKNGGFNDGYAASVAIAPYATSTTSWEWRVPRALTHPTGAGGGGVFDGVGFKYLVTSGSTAGDETSAVLTYTFAPPSVAATITIDGNGADWPAIAKVYDDVTGDQAGAPSDVKAVWLAHDADYIYLRVDTWNAHDYAAFYNNTYLDTDLAGVTGFHPHGSGFGSELLLQNGGVYSEKNGGWNEGAPTSPGGRAVAMAPTGGSATTWEWRLPRDLVHPGGGGAVFTAPGQAFRLLVTSDNVGAAELAPDSPGTQEVRYVPAP
jgi:hypothetical protein